MTEFVIRLDFSLIEKRFYGSARGGDDGCGTMWNGIVSLSAKNGRETNRELMGHVCSLEQ
jgi:hypothetical protein